MSTAVKTNDSELGAELELVPNFAKTQKLLEEGIGSEVYPGALLVVGREGKELFRHCIGKRTKEEQLFQMLLPDTVFDIGELTEVVCTTTLCMKFSVEGRLNLEERVARYIQGFSVFGKSSITVGHLLSHTSGLPTTSAFYEELLRAHSGSRMGILTSRGARDYVLNEITRIRPRTSPGGKQLYSDLNFLLLGFLLEEITGSNLGTLAQRMLFAPLEMRDTSFIDLSKVRAKSISPNPTVIAPTEECWWRERMLCGEVLDENTWAMGGISGRCGIFSTAGDLHRFAQETISAYHGTSSYLPRGVVRSFFSPLGDTHWPWKLGWQSAQPEIGFSSDSLSHSAVGRISTTGCSLWIDPESGIDIVFLSNRAHPNRNNKKINSFLPKLHTAILADLNS